MAEILTHDGKPLDDQLVTDTEAAAFLRIARSTFRTLPFFAERQVRPTPGSVRYRLGDLRLYVHIKSNDRRAA
jgi:hypothetical protein